MADITTAKGYVKQAYNNHLRHVVKTIGDGANFEGATVVRLIHEAFYAGACVGGLMVLDADFGLEGAIEIADEVRSMRHD